jgi:lipooligosaccharide transport system ATP-binding protein
VLPASTPAAPALTDPSGTLGLSLRGVVKAFGDLRAVDGLDLDVRAGTCLGLLGPNGAGKSTTMRLLTAQAVADEGTIEVLGLEVPRQSKQAAAQMGVVPQQDNLDIELTVRQNLQVFARLYRVPRATAPPPSTRARGRAAHRRAGPRSTTCPAACAAAAHRPALVHRPRLVLLDEPTVGLDPQVRQELWALVAALRSEGVTVLMSTHYIEEAERLADDVAVMSAGRVIAFGTPSSLVAEHAGSPVLEVYGPPPRLLEVERIAADAGLPTRRTGPAVAVLRAEGVPDDVAAQLPRRSCAPPRSRTSSSCSPGEGRMSAPTSPLAPAPAARLRRDRAGRRSARSSSARRRCSAASGGRRRSPRSSSRRSTCSRSASASARWWRRSPGYDYIDFVGTGIVATAVLFGSAFPGMFGTFIKRVFQKTYDAVLAAPGRHRGAGDRGGGLDRPARRGPRGPCRCSWPSPSACSRPGGCCSSRWSAC